MGLAHNSTHIFRTLGIFSASALIFGCLYACNNTSTEDHVPVSPREKQNPSVSEQPRKDTSEAQRTVQGQSPDTRQEHSIPAALQHQVQLKAEEPAQRVNLELPSTHIEALQQRVDLLQQPGAQKPEAAKKETRNLKIGGGIITDSDAQDLSKSVEGAEVKVDLKWD